MMNASQMSAMIRAKKKKMEDEQGVTDLSGKNLDAQDIMKLKHDEIGEALSTNVPKDFSEGAALSPESEMSEEEKAQKKAKASKIKLMMAKMSI